MKILIASDHAGFELKKELIAYLIELGYEVADKGPFQYVADDDYPDFIVPVAKEVSKDKNLKAIILGGSGQGEALVANRFENVRAVVYYGSNLDIIKLVREHNDANVLSLGARFITLEEAKEAVRLWLETNFSEDPRHLRRLEKIYRLGNYSDFDLWNKTKKNINSVDTKILFKERDIFYIKMGKNIGYEEDGKGENFSRPILVFKKFNSDVFLGLPLSKTKKEGKYYFHFSFIEGTKSVGLLSQIRLFDGKRLMNKIGMINLEDYQDLKLKISHLLSD